jgi:hypothetical protein
MFAIPVPAACATKTRIQPKTPGWAFVLNFEEFDAAGAPVGCLVVWRVTFAPSHYVTKPCDAVGDAQQIDFDQGRATFNGGYIRCAVNIKESLAALTPPILANDTERYPFFSFIAVGVLAPGTVTAPISNSIAYYAPSNMSAPDVGMFVPVTANGGRFVSRFNRADVVGRNMNTGELVPGREYTFTIEHARPVNTTGTLTLSHYLGTTLIDAVAPSQPVEFWTNGGMFYAGASTLSAKSRLFGNFDEIIFDPPDGGRPPSGADATLYTVFVPVSTRR